MNKSKIILVVCIIIVSLALRLHNYSIYPQRGASSDEYTYSFLGVSLLTKGVPISWSAFPVYKNKYNLTIRKLYFSIVYPYFDHPPLNGILVGGWAMLFGQNVFEKIDLKTIRLVPIFLSVISSLLVFLLGLRLFDYKTGIWALMIYTTTTIFVMNTRVVFAENLLTPLFLGALYIFSIIGNKLGIKTAIMFGILSGLSFWTKELGIVVFFTLFYLFVTEKARPRLIFILCSVFTLFVLLYIAYGNYYDRDLFWQIIFLQSNRHIGPQTLFYLTSTPIIVNKIYYDGWYFFGLLSIFFSLFDFKKNKLIAVGAAAYFILLIFSLTKEGEMGWYMIPLFPFMALASSRILVESLKKQSWFIFVLLLFVGLSQIKLIYENNFGLTPMQFRILLMILFGPFIMILLLKKEKLFNLLGETWFYFFIIGNIILTYNYIHPT